MKRNWLRYVALFGFVGVSGALLLQTSQNVQRAEDRLRTVQNALDAEKESIRVLNAEWDYLNNPERIEALATKYLKLEAPQPGLMLSNPDSLPMAEHETLVSADPPAEITAQPAVLSTPVSSEAPSSVLSTSPIVKPRSKPTPPRKNFNDLLNKVQRGSAP